MASKVETMSNAATETDTMKIKFIFANRDGVTVEIECSPSDTIETITKSLRSHWPEDIEGEAPSIDRIRLICMGKGVLSPLTSTVEENEVPVFLTHPTPVNVSVKPIIVAQAKSGNKSKSVARPSNESDVTSDCCCVIC